MTYIHFLSLMFVFDARPIKIISETIENNMRVIYVLYVDS